MWESAIIKNDRVTTFVMKVFNGRAATEDYTSTHSLTFSTPEMTLKKFVLWLGELIESPDKKRRVPRLIAYLEDKNKDTYASNYAPDITDSFEPSGAVTDMYGAYSKRDFNTERYKPSQLSTTLPSTIAEDTLCIKCGSRMRSRSKFCTSCGAKQS
jgi:tRNA(Ile2) C34 agmatinyltransferase TiaS